MPTATNARSMYPSEIVDRLEEIIESTDWLVSHHAYPDFPPGKDSGDVTHQSFAVGITSTNFLPPDRQRRGGPGLHAESAVVVRWLADLQPDDKRGSYQAALDLEVDLVTRIIYGERDPNLLFRLNSSRRVALSETTLQGEVLLTVRHFYPIEE